MMQMQKCADGTLATALSNRSGRMICYSLSCAFHTPNNMVENTLPMCVCVLCVRVCRGESMMCHWRFPTRCSPKLR